MPRGDHRAGIPGTGVGWGASPTFLRFFGALVKVGLRFSRPSLRTSYKSEKVSVALATGSRKYSGYFFSRRCSKFVTVLSSE